MENKNQIKRLLGMINIQDNGCWNWSGYSRNGYGRLMVGSRKDNTRRTVQAHRFSYKLFNGDIPYGLYVCHKCDNKLCVNPEHLFLGTHQDNIDDRERKNRNNHVVGENVPTSKLTENEVIKIRNSNLSSRKLAEIYGLNKTSILDIKNGINWKHLLPQPPQEGE